MSDIQNFYLIFDLIPFIHSRILNSVSVYKTRDVNKNEEILDFQCNFYYILMFDFLFALIPIIINLLIT